MRSLFFVYTVVWADALLIRMANATALMGQVCFAPNLQVGVRPSSARLIL